MSDTYTSMHKFNYCGIYFLQYGNDTSLTKIGKATWLANRIIQYCTYTPAKFIQGYMVALPVVDKDMIPHRLSYLESSVHRYFSEYHSHGEWFGLPVDFDYENFFNSIGLHTYKKFKYYQKVNSKQSDIPKQGILTSIRYCVHLAALE